MGAARVALARLPKDQQAPERVRGSMREVLRPLGGIEAFVQPGQRVLLKPNQTLRFPHTSGMTTSPPLIAALVELCREAGASEVWVAEAVGHAQQSRAVMSQTGMAGALTETPAHLIYLDEIAHQVFDFGADAGDLRYMPAPEILDRADVIIDVPKAKTHFMDPISGACKNWVGVMPMAYRLTLQREVEPYYRGTALLLRRFRPALTVMDGGWAGEGQGPGANDPIWWGWAIASDDPVALDVTVAGLLGLQSDRVRMANTAAEHGVGMNDPERIEMLGEPAAKAEKRVKPADPSVHRYPCRVIVGEGPGTTMEGTLGHWKTIADGWRQWGVWRLMTLKGTPTFLFGDAEDPDFEEHVREGPYVVLDDSAREEYKHDPRVVFVPGSPVPQSYMQNEMVEGMGFGTVYRIGLTAEQMISKFRQAIKT